MKRKPIAYWRDNDGFHRIMTETSRLRHVMNGHGIYPACVACGKEGYVRFKRSYLCANCLRAVL
jgi:uncharacterized membrane protein